MSGLIREAEDLAAKLDNPASVMIRTLVTQVRGLEKWCESWAKLLEKSQQENLIYKEALERLACLGNGDKHGNSVGNLIAIDALERA